MGSKDNLCCRLPLIHTQCVTRLDNCKPVDYSTCMNITIVELAEFRRQVQDLLDEDEQEKLITYLW